MASERKRWGRRGGENEVQSEEGEEGGQRDNGRREQEFTHDENVFISCEREKGKVVQMGAEM